jgi:hypothetical protein
MLYTVVGKTGSGKSLFQSFTVYEELDRIHCRKMYEQGLLPFYKRWYYYWFPNFSYYDYIVLNSDFNDGRGNFVRYCHSGEECICKVPIVGVHWCYGGYCLGITDLPELYLLSSASPRLRSFYGTNGFIPNCLVMLDEAGTQFSNHDWDKMPEGYRLFLTSHRHNVTGYPMQFDIWVFTQHRDIIEITLKRVSNRIYLVRPLFGYSKNPMREAKFRRLRGIRIWVHWEHELLKHNPIIVDNDGKIKPTAAQDSLESLEFYTWYWFPSFGKKKNKYVSSYDTFAVVRDMSRKKK